MTVLSQGDEGDDKDGDGNDDTESKIGLDSQGRVRRPHASSKTRTRKMRCH